MGPNAVSVRELQQRLKEVLDRVERGATIEVLRRRRPVARLTPVPQLEPPAPWPDLHARARSIFGERRLYPGLSEELAADRGER